MVNNQKKILTEKQAIKENIGSFYHPTEKTYRTGACPEGMILKRGYERDEYIKKDGTIIPRTYVNATCVKDKGELPGKLIKNYIPKQMHHQEHRRVLTKKQAQKEPVGSYYHPTEKTVRSGACPDGFELRKGYTRSKYTKTNGTEVAETYIDPICIKNKGIPGKRLNEFKPIHLNKKNSFEPYGYKTTLNSNTRFNILLNAIKDLSYSKVVHRLSALRTLTKESNASHSKIYNNDMKKLKEWREQNPNLHKHTNKNDHVNANDHVTANGHVNVNTKGHINVNANDHINVNSNYHINVNSNDHMNVNPNDHMNVNPNSHMNVNENGHMNANGHVVKKYIINENKLNKQIIEEYNKNKK